MKRFLVFTISILALALTPACEGGGGDGSGGTDVGGGTDAVGGTDTGGGGGGGGGGGLDSGIDGTKALSEVTDEEQITACENTSTYYNANLNPEDMQKMSCLMAGMMAEVFGEAGACQGAYDACMAEPHEMEEEECEAEDLSSCTDVTVDEFEACLDAQLTQAVAGMAAMAAMDCDSMMAAAMDPDPDPGMDEEEELPAECAVVEENCPQLLEDDDEMGNDFDMDM